MAAGEGSAVAELGVVAGGQPRTAWVSLAEAHASLAIQRKHTSWEVSAMAGMHELLALGQSVWLDFISRGLVRGGQLKHLVDHGLRGLTSNPSIFEKAIASGSDYDDEIQAILRRDPDCETTELFEQLAITDIREAADVLRGVYENSRGQDGFVSLEVSPHLAHETDATIAEAARLWRAVDRPNLMIKVPATPAGVVAIADLIAAGVNVNATLLFSLDHYEAVAHAYLLGLKRAADPSRIASVASFFVSRVDTLIDKKLDAMGTPQARSLRGRAAVANARLAYHRFREIFHAPQFEPLRRRGARAQRVLFGSTSTKDPAYSDVKYVEELIGQETVNTLPPETIDAFMDHGRARLSLTEGVTQARTHLESLAALGINMHTATEELQADGVRKFAEAYDKLIEALEAKRERLLQPAH
jgi:transaldolase/transaldolase/glucose-6-phosphate isomerase